MINIFGTTIEAPKISAGYFFDSLLTDVAKNNAERDTLREFLTPRLADIAQRSIPNMDGVDIPAVKPQAQENFLSQLKSSGAFEKMVLGVINTKTSREILQGKSPALPPTFPGQHKNAEALVIGSISSSIGENECRQYLHQKAIKSRIQSIAKDLFFAVNHGLNPEQCHHFMGILYELDKISTSPFIGNIREIISSAILNQQPVELVHIKSLRFTYPGGDRLRILEDTTRVVQKGHHNETRIYPSEEVIIDRLANIVDTLKSFSVDANLSIIISDHDLDYCFPPEQKIVDPSDVFAARQSVDRYLKYLRSTHPQLKNILSLTEYLHQNNITQKYTDLFHSLVLQGENGGGKQIPEKILEMRVNSQFEHYSQMFKSYNRDLARFTAISQIANIMALSVIFESFPTTPILAIDSRGFEDQLIGGFNPKSNAKLFTKLKDPTEII